MMISATSALKPAASSASLTAAKSSGGHSTSKPPSSSAMTSSAPASSAASISASSLTPGANRNWPQCLNMKDTEFSAPILPPCLLNAWRTGHGAHTVVGHAVDDDGRAADAVAFVADLLVGRAVLAAGAAADRAGHVILRHIGVGRLVDGQAQARIGRDIAAAHARGDRDFLDQSGPDLAALGVRRGFFMLDVGPFAVSSHVRSSLGGKSVRATF